MEGLRSPGGRPLGPGVSSCALYERYRGVVRARAWAVLGTRDLAEDATQEVFLRILEGQHEPSRHPAPAAWLKRVTTNYCLNRLRDERRRGELLELATVTEGEEDNAVERRTIVVDILRRVPRQLGDIAVHYHCEEMTRDEIADRLRLSRRTIGTRLLSLRAALEELVSSSAT